MRIPDFQADRLREAREARGISTLASLAGLLGVDPSTVSRWEQGESSPNAEMLIELGRVLKVRTTYFLRPMFSHGASPAFFRSLAHTKKYELARQRSRLAWLQELSIIIQHYVDFPPLDLPDFLGGAEYHQLRNEDIEDIAQSLRNHWKLGDQPIADMVGLLEKAGFILGVDDVGTAALDGLCHWSTHDRRPYIVLANDKMSFFRRQMDAAHEMAHAVLHRNVSQEELRRNFKFIEDQAFRLASAFLMPAARFSLEVDFPSIPLLTKLKDKQKVSIKAMIKRCGDLNLVDKEEQQQLYKYYSARKWNREEPLDNTYAPSKPRLLAQGLQMIVESGTRSKEELLSNEFTISAYDIETLLALKEGWFNQNSAEILLLKRDAQGTPSKFEESAKIIEFRRKLSDRSES